MPNFCCFIGFLPMSLYLVFHRLFVRVYSKCIILLLSVSSQRRRKNGQNIHFKFVVGRYVRWAVIKWQSKVILITCHWQLFFSYFVVRINMSSNLGDVSNEPFILCFVYDEKIQYRKIFQVSLLRRHTGRSFLNSKSESAFLNRQIMWFEKCRFPY